MHRGRHDFPLGLGQAEELAAEGAGATFGDRQGADQSALLEREGAAVERRGGGPGSESIMISDPEGINLDSAIGFP